MTYDAIIVGARVAGSATGLLLARKGLKVLLVDRASFPSDTISTHYVHLSGIAKLKAWGLLDRLKATGCAAVRDVLFDFGAFTFNATPTPAEGGITEAFGPRRTVLDKLLVDAAVEAGCELREHYTVDGLLTDNGAVQGIQSKGSSERAGIVIGADGIHSLVARAVEAPKYDDMPALTCAYYAYWSGLDVEKAELYIRPRSTRIAFPTNDGLTVQILSLPIVEFPRFRLDHEAAYLDAMPESVRAGRRETRVFGTADLENFYRKPYGKGWALVGDAGYHKDPITAQGISDAFRDAELLSNALARTLSGETSGEQAFAEYEECRNSTTRANYHFTRERASYEPPPPQMLQLLEALAESPADANRFAGIDAGTVRCEDFFHPENVQRIMAGATPALMRRATLA